MTSAQLIFKHCASQYFTEIFFSSCSSVLYGAFYEKSKSTESQKVKSIQTAGNKVSCLSLWFSSIVFSKSC